jgi:hypothetical protein
VQTEALVLVLMMISADPKARPLFELEHQLPRLLAPFTDHDYCHVEDAVRLFASTVFLFLFLFLCGPLTHSLRRARSFALAPSPSLRQ